MKTIPSFSMPGLPSSLGNSGYSRALPGALGDCKDCMQAPGTNGPSSYDHLMDDRTFLERLGIDFKAPVSVQEAVALGGVALCVGIAIWLSRPSRKKGKQ